MFGYILLHYVVLIFTPISIYYDISCLITDADMHVYFLCSLVMGI